jgi:hypothetical protein
MPPGSWLRRFPQRDFGTAWAHSYGSRVAVHVTRLPRTQVLGQPRLDCSSDSEPSSSWYIC